MRNNHTEPEDQAPPPAATPAWLLTFTDLTALLLAFFVLLLSMTQIKVETWEAITQSLTRELNPAQWRAIETGGGDQGVEEIFVSRAANLDYLGALMTEKIRDHPMLGRGHLTRLDDRLVLSLPGDLVFDSGQATLSEDGMGATEVFPSNWEFIAGPGHGHG